MEQTLRNQPVALVKLNDGIAALAAINDLLVKSRVARYRLRTGLSA